jgi:hypothetical protein
MGINLGEKYFSHGHLYVASSKGGSAKGNWPPEEIHQTFIKKFCVQFSSWECTT